MILDTTMIKKRMTMKKVMKGMKKLKKLTINILMKHMMSLIMRKNLVLYNFLINFFIVQSNEEDNAEN